MQSGLIRVQIPWTPDRVVGASLLATGRDLVASKLAPTMKPRVSGSSTARLRARVAFADHGSSGHGCRGIAALEFFPDFRICALPESAQVLRDLDRALRRRQQMQRSPARGPWRCAACRPGRTVPATSPRARRLALANFIFLYAMARSIPEGNDDARRRQPLRAPVAAASPATHAAPGRARRRRSARRASSCRRTRGASQSSSDASNAASSGRSGRSARVPEAHRSTLRTRSRPIAPAPRSTGARQGRARRTASHNARAASAGSTRPALAAQALCEAVADLGLASLPWTEGLQQFVARVRCVRQWFPDLLKLTSLPAIDSGETYPGVPVVARPSGVRYARPERRVDHTDRTGRLDRPVPEPRHVAMEHAVAMQLAERRRDLRRDPSALRSTHRSVAGEPLGEALAFDQFSRGPHAPVVLAHGDDPREIWQSLGVGRSPAAEARAMHARSPAGDGNAPSRMTLTATGRPSPRHDPNRARARQGP